MSEKTPTIKDLQREIAANLAATTRIIRESNEAQAERNKASDERMTRFEQGLAKTGKKLDEIGERLDATGKRLDKTEKMLKDLTLKYGLAGNVRGFSFERAVYRTIAEAKEFCNIRLTKVDFDIRTGRRGYQYDIIGVNGKSAIVMEAKVSLSSPDVHRFADKQLPAFANLLPDYAKGKRIVGALIYQRTDTEGAAVAEALSRGLLVVCADSQKHLHQITNINQIQERANTQGE